MLRRSIAGVLLLAIGIVGSAAATSIDRDMVPDSATAIKVASAILETYMGKNSSSR